MWEIYGKSLFVWFASCVALWESLCMYSFMKDEWGFYKAHKKNLENRNNMMYKDWRWSKMIVNQAIRRVVGIGLFFVIFWIGLSICFTGLFVSK